MAKNLQSKLSVRDKITVFDINEDAMERFASDIKDSKPGGATISIASSSSEAAKTAVCAGRIPLLLAICYFLYTMNQI